MRSIAFFGLALLFSLSMALGADLGVGRAKGMPSTSAKEPSGNDAVNTALVQSVLAGDHAGLASALSKGADVDTTIFINYQGQQPTLSVLTIAALLADLPALRQLRDARARVERSCDISYLIGLLEPLNSILPNSVERKAVFNNIMRSQSELLCYLYTDYQLDPAKRDHQLIAAVSRGDLTGVKALLSNGADKNARETKLPGRVVWPGRTCLMIAMLERRIDIAHVLITAGVDLNAKASVGSTWGGWDGFTALMLATRLELSGLVKALVTSGADVTLADEEDYQAIHHAANNAEALKTLIEAMPTPEKKRELITRKTRGGDTALVLATRSRNPEAARYLIDVGMSVFGPDYLEFWGSSALIEAVTHREYRAQRERDRLASRQKAAIILTELLQKGADANTADENGVTVLMRAIQDGSDLSVIQSLMAHKANPRAIDNSGRDAYHYARERTDADDVVGILGK